MTASPTLIAKLLLDNKKFRAQLAQSGKAANQTFAKTANTFRRSVLGIAAATGAMVAGVSTVHKSFVSLEQKAGGVAVGFGKTTRELLTLAKTLGDEHKMGRGEDPFLDIVGALESLQKQGIATAEEAEATLPQYQLLADALGVTLTQAVDEVGSALRAVGAPLNDAWRYSDAFTAATRVGGQDVAAFSAFIRDNADALEANNLTIRHAAAALIDLDARGISGARAIAQLSEAVQGGSEFTEVFADRLGRSREALDYLTGSLGEGNRVTQTYAATITDTMTGLDELGRKWGVTRLGYGDLIRQLEGSAATMDIPRQGFNWLADSIILDIERMLIALAEWDRRVAASSGFDPNRIGSATNTQTGQSFPIFTLPTPTNPEGLPPPATSDTPNPRPPASTAPDRPSYTMHEAAALGLIPEFATGGVVTGPTLGMIGEAGPEAILPLDRLEQMLLAPILQANAGSSVNERDALTSGASGGGGGSVHVTIMEAHFRDGRDLLELARSKGVGFL